MRLEAPHAHRSASGEYLRQGPRRVASRLVPRGNPPQAVHELSLVRRATRLGDRRAPAETGATPERPALVHRAAPGGVEQWTDAFAIRVEGHGKRTPPG